MSDNVLINLVIKAENATNAALQAVNAGLGGLKSKLDEVGAADDAVNAQMTAVNKTIQDAAVAATEAAAAYDEMQSSMSGMGAKAGAEAAGVAAANDRITESALRAAAAQRAANQPRDALGRFTTAPGITAMPQSVWGPAVRPPGTFYPGAAAVTPPSSPSADTASAARQGFIAGLMSRFTGGGAGGGTGGSGGGIMSSLGFGRAGMMAGALGLGGLAGFGTVGGLAGFGPEHVVTTALGLGGSAVGAGIGGGLLGAGALGTMLVGGGSNMAVSKSTLADTKSLYTSFTALQAAIQQYGASSTQAATATATLNQTMTSLGNTAGVQAELGLAEAASALNAFWDQVSSGARVALVNLVTPFLMLGYTYLPMISDAAQRNFGIMQVALQPLLAYLQGPMIGVFNKLEDIYAKNLPSAMSIFVNGFEILVNTVSTASNYVGGFTEKVAAFVEKLNTPSGLAAWDTEIGKLIALFHTWMDLLVAVGKSLYLIFSQGVGLGTSVVQSLTQMVDRLNTYLGSTSGKNAMNTLFTAHKEQILALLQLIPLLLSAIAPVYLVLSPAFVNVATVMIRALTQLMLFVEQLHLGAVPIGTWGIGLGVIALKMGLLPGLIAGVTGGMAGFRAIAMGVQAAQFGAMEATNGSILAMIAYRTYALLAAGAQAIWNVALAIFDAEMDVNPIGLVIIAIAALIAIIVLVVTHWKQVTEVVQTAWDKLKDFASWLATSPLGKTIFGPTVQAGTAPAGAAGVSGLGGGLTGSVTGGGGAVTQASGASRVLSATSAATIGSQVQAVIDDFKKLFDALSISNIEKVVGGFFSGMGTAVHNGINAIKNWLNQWWVKDLETLLELPFAASYVLIYTAVEKIWGGIRSVWDTITSFLENSWYQITSNANINWTQIWSTITGFTGKIWSDIQSIWNKLTGWIGTQWSNLVGTAGANWGQSGLYGTITGWVSQIQSKLQSIWNGITGDAGNAWNGLVGTIKNAVGQIVKIINDLVSAVNNAGVPGIHLSPITLGPTSGPPIATGTGFFAHGGIVPGLGAGDTYPAMLTPGEVVLNRAAVAGLGGPAAANKLNGLGAGVADIGSMIGQIGGQCLAWVTHITGLFAGVPAAIDLMPDINSHTAAAGEVFVMNIAPYGHTGFVVGSGNPVPVIDSNWNLDEVIRAHTIPAGEIAGYINIGKGVPGLSGALGAMLDPMGTIEGLVQNALGDASKLTGWPGAATAEGIINMILNSLKGMIGSDASAVLSAASAAASAPSMGRGGIVNAATLALIGESGPEAVVPLTGGAGGVGGGNLTINIGGLYGTDPQATQRWVDNTLMPAINRNFVQWKLPSSGYRTSQISR